MHYTNVKSNRDFYTAALGAIFPAINGSAVKSVLKSIGKALGIDGDAAKGVNKVVDAANVAEDVKDGTFSVLKWDGYPAGGVKPSGTLRILDGAEYIDARNAANSTNAAIRKAVPEALKGLHIHEVKPVKFGGSPTDPSNKIYIPPAEHSKYTNFWNSLLRDINNNLICK